MVYSTAQIASTCGISARLVNYYRKEIPIPPQKGGGKRGEKLEFPEQALREFMLVGDMWRIGMNISMVRTVIVRIREKPTVDIMGWSGCVKLHIERP
jgi:DNA-binding transcriptional MerR regulator